ncbi:hypothetical protein [Streptomyces sp. NPDC127190]|uniref:hypothetical protein n=1 Tax=unclassified Streptomyces TaxID=2593676 RepID=UPI003624C492
MELPAENKRAALLALAVLGVLLVAVLAVLTFFSGDNEETSGSSGTTPSASAPADQGDGSTSGSAGRPGAPAATPIVSLAELAKAHAVMTQYMAGLNTYDHNSSTASWSPPLLELTTGELQMKQLTALPSGKTWAECKAGSCSSKGTAVVERDAVISDDLVRGSGRTISSLVKVTTTRVTSGKSTTESTEWLVSAKENGGQWLVNGFNIFGLGDVGASDESGE